MKIKEWAKENQKYTNKKRTNGVISMLGKSKHDIQSIKQKQREVLLFFDEGFFV